MDWTRALTLRLQMNLLNCPSHPSNQVFSAQELQQVCQVLIRHGTHQTSTDLEVINSFRTPCF
jgi:aspartate/methionine/tyrosine aminotransferase